MTKSIFKEKFKTHHDVFDDFTDRNLFKLMSQGHFKGLIGPVAVGKEANVFSAQRDDGTKVAVKIYRLETCDFNRMYDNIKYDTRYLGLEKKRRKVIFAWAQREYRNLLKAREAGVRVPKPSTCLFNILVLEFIGNAEAAPMLKDLRPKNPNKFFKEVISNMKKLHKAGLVHGDLSDFNILNNKEKPVFIDFSQCSPLESTNAKELYQRDVRNIARIFSKIGVKTSEEELSKFLRGK